MLSPDSPHCSRECISRLDVGDGDSFPSGQFPPSLPHLRESREIWSHSHLQTLGWEERATHDDGTRYMLFQHDSSPGVQTQRDQHVETSRTASAHSFDGGERTLPLPVDDEPRHIWPPGVTWGITVLPFGPHALVIKGCRDESLFADDWLNNPLSVRSCDAGASVCQRVWTGSQDQTQMRRFQKRVPLPHEPGSRKHIRPPLFGNELCDVRSVSCASGPHRDVDVFALSV